LLEYDAPRSLLNSNSIAADQDLIARFRQGPLPPNLDAREVGRTLDAALATALDLNDASNAAAILHVVSSQPESATRDIAAGRLALLRGATTEAQTAFEAARRLDTTSPDAAYWLATAERQSGNTDAALSQIRALLRTHPKFSPALEEQMEIAADQNDFQAALAAQLTRMDLMPGPPAYEYGRLGALWKSLSNFPAAESALLKGLAKDPYCYACHLELGELYLRTGKYQLSQQHLKWVIRFFPDSDPVAFRSLVAVDLILRDQRAAQSALSEGLRLFPSDAALLKAQPALGG
jgi:tetratricopeptide (TPR) repeat protein